MPTSLKFIVITVRLFYAGTRPNGLVAKAISSGSDGRSLSANGSSFTTDSLRSLIAARESGDLARLLGLERGFFALLFALQGGCVVRCLPYHARSFGRFRAFQRQARTACGL